MINNTRTPRLLLWVSLIAAFTLFAASCGDAGA